MLLNHRTCAAATLAIAGLFPAAANAQDAFQSSLPASTSLYVGAADIPSAIEGFKTSALYKIWKSEETQEFFADLMDMAEAQYAQAMKQAKQMHEAGMLPVAPEKLAQLRLDGFHFAITDLQLPTQDNPMPRVGVVLSLDFGSSAPVVKELIASMMPMMAAQMGPNAPEPQVKEVAGSKLSTMMLPDVPPFLSFNWGFSGSQLLISTDTARLESLMTSMAQGGDGGFLGGKLYRSVDSKIGGRSAAFEMYMDLESMMNTGMAGMRMAAAMSPNADVDFAGIERAIEALGIKGMKGMGMRTGWENGKAFIDSFMMVPKAERKGLSELIAADTPVNREHLAWVPKDVASFSLGAMPQMSGLYNSIMEAVKAYDPQAHKFAEMQLQGLKDQLGFDVAALFGSMGGEMMFYQKPVVGMMATPEMLISMGCSNPDVMLDQVKKAMMLSEGMVELTEEKGESGTIYGIQMNMGGGGLDAMISPAIAFEQGQMLFALNRSDITEALKRMRGKSDAEDIRKHPEFASYLQKLPAGATGISFTDMKASIEGVYGTMSSMIALVEIPANIPLDLGLLPTTETIIDPLFAQVTWSETDDDGIVSRSVGPMGPEYLAILGGAVVGGLVVFAMEADEGIMRIR
jgi:hypothetical protein